MPELTKDRFVNSAGDDTGMEAKRGASLEKIGGAAKRTSNAARYRSVVPTTSPPSLVEASLHFSPRGVTSCVRGASVRGAFGLTPTPLNQRRILDARSKTVGKRKEGLPGLSPASPVRR